MSKSGFRDRRSTGDEGVEDWDGKVALGEFGAGSMRGWGFGIWIRGIWSHYNVGLTGDSCN
jgi:hypothetical protein